MEGIWWARGSASVLMSGDNGLFYGGLFQSITGVPPPLFHIGVAFPTVDFTSWGIGIMCVPIGARYWMFRKALEDLFFLYPKPRPQLFPMKASRVETLKAYVILELTKSQRIVLCNLVQNLSRVMSLGSKGITSKWTECKTIIPTKELLHRVSHPKVITPENKRLRWNVTKPNPAYEEYPPLGRVNLT
jgi:hypothetical protein